MMDISQTEDEMKTAVPAKVVHTAPKKTQAAQSKVTKTLSSHPASKTPKKVSNEEIKSKILSAALKKNKGITKKTPSSITKTSKISIA